MRRILLTSTLLATAVYAADFERINWRSQLYVQGEPAYLNFEGGKIDEEVFSVPVSGGFLWSPLITPFWKADIPFTLWLGLEVNSFQMGTIGKDPKGNELSYMTFAPSLLAGFTFNIAGDLDLRVLGGFGRHYFEITNEKTDKEAETVFNTAFVSGALEYSLTEIFQDVDLKIGVNVRKEFLAYEDIDGTSKNVFDMKYKWPVRVGLELSLDFGRESRRDRQMRFKLHDRDGVLRVNSEVKDTLSDWDCMTIERDYGFRLDENGNLPDKSEAFTHTQFADVLESFLSFCHPADLATKERLYAKLDSGKIEIKEYQASQEDARFEQVMASNDPEMLQMFLDYYPDSPRRAEIEARLHSKSEYEVFQEARQKNNFKAYLAYLNDNPNGAFRDEAEASIFELVKAGKRKKDYEIYLKRFPNGKYVEEAKAALQAINQGQNP